MADRNDIREHMEVIGSDGGHIGTVDHLDAERIKLAKKDPGADGVHHWIDMSLVTGVESDKVRLSIDSKTAPEVWASE